MNKVLPFLLCLVWAFGCLDASGKGALALGNVIAGRQVVAAVVNAQDLTPINFGTEEVVLAVKRQEIGSSADIYKLLQTNGIAPDSEAFTLVYELNPSLRELKGLPPGTVLQLPRLASDSLIEKVRQAGGLAILTVDPDLRDALNRSGEVLQQSINSLLESSLPPTPSSDSLKGDLESLRLWYAQIKRSFLHRTGPPLRRDSLVQLRREADELNDVSRIAAFHEDVEVEMTNYDQELANELPKADALYKVSVSIGGANAKALERVRVYYTVYGLFRNPPGKDCDSFKSPGSGASELMRVQNYMIWAAEDGDPGHPVTEPLRVKVRPWDAEPILVALSASKGQH
ncbi:MAG: hypothetical protein ABSH39_24165 [Candidatus Acidiferrum sp.]